MRGLILVDGNAAAWRCSTVGTQHPTAEDFDPTVLYKLTDYLLGLQRGYPDHRVLPVFDGGHSEVRIEIDPAYKAHRKDVPGRALCIKRLNDCLVAFASIRTNVLRVFGVEADDLISLICHRCRAVGVQAVIISDDRDLFQCLGDGVTQYLPMKDRVVTADEALQDWGGSVQRFLIWKALAGDQGDGIKGVRGIGEKRAHELLALCRGEWQELFTPRMQRLTEGKRAFSALFEGGAKLHFMKQLRLVKTATDYNEVGVDGSLLPGLVRSTIDTSIRRIAEPIDVPPDDWKRFLVSYQMQPFTDRLPQLEKLFGIRIWT
jgi:5'-3' exonuclease